MLLFACAVSPDDFTSVNTSLTFAPLQSRVCVNVTIIMDNVVEQTESFSVSIIAENMYDNIELGPRTSLDITIINDDGEFIYIAQIITSLLNP